MSFSWFFSSQLERLWSSGGRRSIGCQTRVHRSNKLRSEGETNKVTLTGDEIRWASNRLFESNFHEFSRVMRMLTISFTTLVLIGVAWYSSRNPRMKNSRKRLAKTAASVAIVVAVFLLAASWLISFVKEVLDGSECPSQMAVSVDLGRLGNKFFEFMAARFLARALGMAIYVTPEFAFHYDRYFTGRKTPIVDWIFLQYKCHIAHSQFVDLNVDYLSDLNPVNSSYPYIKFHGYPVDIAPAIYRAIFTERDQLISEFQWRPELRRAAQNQLDRLRRTRNRSTIVGIHVRRTDYSTYLLAYFGSYNPADASYFSRAMDHFKSRTSNPLFFVFSDDMDWCRENIKGPDVIYAGSGNGSEPGLDLAMMAFCDHLILTYGTFGMLAAWLNNGGEVVSAENFTGQPEKMVENLKQAQPPNWSWLPIYGTNESSDQVATTSVPLTDKPLSA